MFKLKQCRINAGFTQKEVAEHLGITRAAYTNIENGRRNLDSAMLAILAELFGVPADYIIGLHDKLPVTNDDDGLRSEIMSRISALPDQYLPRVLSYLDGIRAGLDIQALASADRDPASPPDR